MGVSGWTKDVGGKTSGIRMVCGLGSKNAPTSTSGFDKSLWHEEVTVKEELGEGSGALCTILELFFQNKTVKIKKAETLREDRSRYSS